MADKKVAIQQNNQQEYDINRLLDAINNLNNDLCNEMSRFADVVEAMENCAGAMHRIADILETNNS